MLQSRPESTTKLYRYRWQAESWFVNIYIYIYIRTAGFCSQFDFRLQLFRSNRNRRSNKTSHDSILRFPPSDCRFSCRFLVCFACVLTKSQTAHVVVLCVVAIVIGIIAWLKFKRRVGDSIASSRSPTRAVQDESCTRFLYLLFCVTVTLSNVLTLVASCREESNYAAVSIQAPSSAYGAFPAGDQSEYDSPNAALT